MADPRAGKPDPGIKIVEKEGIFHLSGILNEYADFSALLTQKEPLRLDMREVTRLNSIGIRNLLKFLADWSPRKFIYLNCPSEFIDQVNMIPALLGNKNNGEVETLLVPFACEACDSEEEVLGRTADYAQQLASGGVPSRTCGKCGGKMTVLTDSFFVFLGR